MDDEDDFRRAQIWLQAFGNLSKITFNYLLYYSILCSLIFPFRQPRFSHHTQV